MRTFTLSDPEDILLVLNALACEGESIFMSGGDMDRIMRLRNYGKDVLATLKADSRELNEEGDATWRP